MFIDLFFRVPSFKGYQQQDSHELLRNLLDAVKCEELKVIYLYRDFLDKL